MSHSLDNSNLICVPHCGVVFRPVATVLEFDATGSLCVVGTSQGSVHVLDFDEALTRWHIARRETDSSRAERLALGEADAWLRGHMESRVTSDAAVALSDPPVISTPDSTAPVPAPDRPPKWRQRTLNFPRAFAESGDVIDDEIVDVDDAEVARTIKRTRTSTRPPQVVAGAETCHAQLGKADGRRAIHLTDASLSGMHFEMGRPVVSYVTNGRVQQCIFHPTYQDRLAVCYSNFHAVHVYAPAEERAGLIVWIAAL